MSWRPDGCWATFGRQNQLSAAKIERECIVFSQFKKVVSFHLFLFFFEKKAKMAGFWIYVWILDLRLDISKIHLDISKSLDADPRCLVARFRTQHQDQVLPSNWEPLRRWYDAEPRDAESSTPLTRPTMNTSFLFRQSFLSVDAPGNDAVSLSAVNVFVPVRPGFACGRDFARASTPSVFRTWEGASAAAAASALPAGGQTRR